MVIEPRSSWGAKPPKQVTSVYRPDDFKGVCVHWFGKPPMAQLHTGCDDLLRAVQRAHMAPGGLGAASGGNDIGYNFAVCPHGHVYALRGFHRSGANGTRQSNRDYLAVVYMAGVGDPFTDPGKQMISELIAYLRERGTGTQVVCHGDITGSTCPGPVITPWVKAKLYELPYDPPPRLAIDVMGETFRLVRQDWDNKAVQTRIFRALKNGEVLKISKSKET